MEKRLVVSASRRTDLVGCFPEALEERLGKYPPGKVHTLVLWTKNPANLIRRRSLRELLSRYAQIYVHLTITGLGGSVFEPRIPGWEEIAGLLPGIAAAAKSPERICWRFDPILEAEKNGKEFSNLAEFPKLAEAVASIGIKRVKASWVSPYRKVVARLAGQGYRLLERTAEERKKQAGFLKEVCEDYGFTLDFCAMEGFPTSRCIDGEEFSRLHPEGLGCSVERAAGQRELCGCTKSLDIGWYADRCRHGCLYCYALP
jgi:DNA repair photolyase